MALITETKNNKWKKLVEILIAKGFKKRTPNSLRLRWRDFLNVDTSEITKEEEQLILEMYI